MANEIQLAQPQENNFEPQQPPLRLKNSALNELVVTTLFNTSGKAYLPYGQNILFSGNIYAIRKRNDLPAFASTLEINKRDSITDFGMVAFAKWPLIQQENWSMNINGKVTGSKQYLGVIYQRNRWNFEHQIGFNAVYSLAGKLRASLGIYHYRIIDETHNDNPDGSYINSGGGFARLFLHF